MIPCTKCSRQFETEKGRAEHQRIAHAFPCQCCEKMFISQDDLKKHHRQGHQQAAPVSTRRAPDPFPCGKCSKKFGSAKALKSHETDTHDFRCPTCKKQFETVAQLQDHQKQPHAECPFCRKAFVNLEAAAQHAESGGCKKLKGQENASRAVYQFVSQNPQTQHFLANKGSTTRLLSLSYGDPAGTNTQQWEPAPAKNYQCPSCGKQSCRASGVLQHQSTSVRCQNDPNATLRLQWSSAATIPPATQRKGAQPSTMSTMLQIASDSLPDRSVYASERNLAQWCASVQLSEVQKKNVAELTAKLLAPFNALGCPALVHGSTGRGVAAGCIKVDIDMCVQRASHYDDDYLIRHFETCLRHDLKKQWDSLFSRLGSRLYIFSSVQHPDIWMELIFLSHNDYADHESRVREMSQACLGPKLLGTGLTKEQLITLGLKRIRGSWEDGLAKLNHPAAKRKLLASCVCEHLAIRAVKENPYADLCVNFKAAFNLLDNWDHVLPKYVRAAWNTEVAPELGRHTAELLKL